MKSGFPPAALTGTLVRAGRALARVSAAELASTAGVSVVTIKRVEASSGTGGLRETTASAIISALEGYGVELVDGMPNAHGPGVRFSQFGAHAS